MVNSKVQDLKEKGNQCTKDGKYAEAIFHYTHAIKIDPDQYQLYSNRSLAFLKMDQYYYAREDAIECIKLNPSWAKAYFRKGEVEYECGYYDEALDSFRNALQLQGDDKSILEAIRKTKREQYQMQKANVQVPWVGAGSGFVFGVFLVVADHVFQASPLFLNPLLKLLVIFVCTGLLFTGARIYRYYIWQSKRSMMECPVDLLGDNVNLSSEDAKFENLAQPQNENKKARQRQKKPKS